MENILLPALFLSFYLCELPTGHDQTSASSVFLLLTFILFCYYLIMSKFAFCNICIVVTLLCVANQANRTSTKFFEIFILRLSKLPNLDQR